MSINKIQIESLEHKISPLRTMEVTTPPVGGWVNAIRTSLNMTLSQLAKRVGTNASRVKRIEQDEISGSVTLKTLSNLAAAMDSELVYVIVPKKSIKNILVDRYLKKHAKKAEQLERHMKLEGQGVFKDPVSEYVALEDIKTKGLWDD